MYYYLLAIIIIHDLCEWFQKYVFITKSPDIIII